MSPSVRPRTIANRSAMAILADAPGNRSFETVEQVDDYIQKERDSWHS